MEDPFLSKETNQEERQILQKFLQSLLKFIDMDRANLLNEGNVASHAMSQGVTSGEYVKKTTDLCDRLESAVKDRMGKLAVDEFWAEVDGSLNEEESLFKLYSTLNEELCNPKTCNNFLRFSIGRKMDSDQIVHILNALSPIKGRLRDWDAFVTYSTGLLINEVGELEAKVLLDSLLA